MRKVLVILCLGVFAAGGLWVRQRQRVAGASTEAGNNKIAGIVLPHHDLARELIIGSLEQISDEYELIVILSPNHFRPQGPEITTTDDYSYLPVEKITDNRLVEEEHGINVPAKYLTHYFPEAKILPILFSNQADPQLAEKLADVLVQQTQNKNVLFVASADFAHDRMSQAGLKNNQETIETINKFDYRTLFTYGDDHIDSRGAMATLMKIMQKTGAARWETWHNSHGAILTGNPTLNGTGYVIGVFWAK